MDLRAVSPTIAKPDHPALERHYRLAELADLWALSSQTIRRLVKDEPDVIRVRLGPKQALITYSVPESVARRIHNRLVEPAR